MQAERTDYADRLAAMTDAEFVRETYDQIDRANLSPVYSEADARAGECYTEAVRRERLDLYQRAFKAAYYMAKGMQRLGDAYLLLEKGARP